MAYQHAFSQDCTQRPHRSLIRTLLQAVELRQQRRNLARLSSEQLSDIGITRRQAMDEAARNVWNAPQHWFK